MGSESWWSWIWISKCCPSFFLRDFLCWHPVKGKITIRENGVPQWWSSVSPLYKADCDITSQKHNAGGVSGGFSLLHHWRTTWYENDNKWECDFINNFIPFYASLQVTGGKIIIHKTFILSCSKWRCGFNRVVIWL